MKQDQCGANRSLIGALCMKRLIFAAAVVSVGISQAGDYPFRAAEMTNISIKAGFWFPRFETNRIVTVWTDFRKSEETGRINNFKLAGERVGRGFKGIPFNDSDVYKIIEGAAYTLSTHPDPKLEKYLDDLIAHIAKAQEPDGYLYTARTLHFNYGTDKKTGKLRYRMMGPTRWSNVKQSHELYNVGHLYEAAVAYYEVTGKRTLLDVAIKNADFLDRTIGFGQSQLRITSGHQEIELALCKLYRVTGEKRYLNLAKTILDMRGRKDLRKKIWGVHVLDHLPVTKQTEAIGHAVRAAYQYCGMADVAALSGDHSYIKAIDILWDNVVSKKLHLNGGIGARRHVKYKGEWKGHGAAEAFSENYDLPNENTYLETCAAIGNALWNQRMFLMRGDAKYIDVMERTIYNGFLSGISLGGDEFFYPNPLASRGGYKRSKWFGCSCCPVNIVRFIPQIAQFAYATRGDAAYVNLFIASDAKLDLKSGSIKLEQNTEYPWSGLSRITVKPAKDGAKFTLNVRIPGWCVGRPVPSDLYIQTNPGSLADFSVKVNGKPFAFSPEKGYCPITREWKSGDVVEVAMNMPVKRIKAHDAVKQDRGRLAVERGPILYCAESVDNGGYVLDKVVAANATFSDSTCNVLGNTYPALTVSATSLSIDANGKVSKNPVTLKLIPYFAWCHRGAGELQTFFPIEDKYGEPRSNFNVSVSLCHKNDTIKAIFDGVLPKSSGDNSVPRHTFWGHKGTDEWVACEFNEAKTVKGVEVYWYDDTGMGCCRVPAKWKAQWRPAKDSPWRDVEGVGEVARNRFCAHNFPAPVKAQAVRIAVKLQKNYSGGVLEMRIR